MPRSNSWQGLANFLKDYFVDVRPEWQQFLGNYSVDPFQKGVLDEIQRRGSDARGNALGQVASLWGSAGRSGSGGMGRNLRDTAAESLSQEQGLMSQLKSQDYQGFLQNKLGALGKLTDADMAARANVTQGFGDQMRKQAQIRSAQLALEGVMAQVGLGRDRLGFDRYMYNDMAPFNKLGSLGGIFGNLASMFGNQVSSGSQTSTGPSPNPWMSGLQSGLGGAAMGYGASGGKGGGGTTPYNPMIAGNFQRGGGFGWGGTPLAFR